MESSVAARPATRVDAAGADRLSDFQPMPVPCCRSSQHENSSTLTRLISEFSEGVGMEKICLHIICSSSMAKKAPGSSSKGTDE
eukprot:scaffold12094_cov140-Skeletonema_marinoi.AAC.1